MLNVLRCPSPALIPLPKAEFFSLFLFYQISRSFRYILIFFIFLHQRGFQDRHCNSLQSSSQNVEYSSLVKLRETEGLKHLRMTTSAAFIRATSSVPAARIHCRCRTLQAQLKAIIRQVPCPKARVTIT